MAIFNQKEFVNKTVELIFDKLKEKSPLVIAIDGGSGSGKSTNAALLGEKTGATVIPLDDFYAADIPNQDWDRFTKTEKLKRVFQWNRLIETVLQSLLAWQSVSYSTYDFLSPQTDGTYKPHRDLKTLEPSQVIIIDGAYSSSSYLNEFIDLSILIDVPTRERHKRLSLRDDEAFLREWHSRWDIVEEYYFDKVRTKESFDIVVK